MEKLACPAAARHVVQLAQSPAERVAALSRALEKPVHALRIAVQDRPRHKGLVAALRTTGAQVVLFGEGDVAVALQAADASAQRPYDALMGIGAAPEGIITAAAIRCMGAHFEGRFVYDPSEVMSGLIGTCRVTNRSRIKEAGIAEPDAHWSAEELVPASELVVALCGITGGPFVEGITQTPEGHLQTTTRVYGLGASSLTTRTRLQQHHGSFKPHSWA
jgi:fructose-1,6-bisphosphatase II / sedoheptulose-1,7-bisphosphatase